MNDQEALTRSKTITTLFTAFGQAGDGARIAAYVVTLADLPTEILQAACKKLMLESRYLPTIAEIVAAAQNLVGEKNGNRLKEWGEAWREIQTAMLKEFIYGKPLWSTREIELTVKSFGWRELCCTLEDDMPTVRAQLKRIYDSYCARSKEQTINGHVLQHTGLLHDRANGEPQYIIRRDEDLTGLISIGEILLRNNGGET